MKSDGKGGISSLFPRLPLEFGEDGDRSLKILKEADYIARTAGKRSYPWRYFVITEDDRQLIENTMSYRLAEKMHWTTLPGLNPDWQVGNGGTELLLTDQM